jgi:hypothetical protein
VKEVSLCVVRQGTDVLLNGVKDLGVPSIDYRTTRCFVPQHDATSECRSKRVTASQAEMLDHGSQGWDQLSTARIFAKFAKFAIFATFSLVSRS